MLKGIAASNQRTKRTTPQEIIINTLTLDLPHRFGGVVFLGVKQIRVVALLQLFKRKSPVQKELIQEPKTSGIFTGRPGTDIGQEFLFFRRLEYACENGEVDTVIFQCELKMIAQRIARPVLRWKNFLNSVFRSLFCSHGKGAYKGDMPMRNDVKIVSPDKRFVAGSPVRTVLLMFRHTHLLKTITGGTKAL
ncbi:MAG: hypothetical protein BWY09_00928 [Candidatus Hydrogenedentes bacterium ADurb.Bin179]|nr:MAG: hypothetical protein BWY09_00928 [Candidatus Hydrogenedentes bacterium ADurb.Bin179]